MNYDVVIIGGGGAGLMAAIEAGKNDKSVLLLEHNRQVGQKILISGGGRCNFTNINASPENYISSNPHFIKSAFSEYKPGDFIEMVEKHGIEYYEKTLGQLFCRKSSREIVAMLLEECDRAGVDIKTNTKVKSISNKAGLFTIKTTDTEWNSNSCVIATGGLSFPKKGATDFGYRIAKQFGHNIITLEPGLVPFTLHEKDLVATKELSGLSFDSNSSLDYQNKPKHKNKKINFTEATLLTHKGLSGPAILQISSYWKKGDTLKLNILPNLDWNQVINSERNSNREVKKIIGQHLPQRFADYLVEKSDADTTTSQLSKKAEQRLMNSLNAMELVPDGTEGYPKAEVTIGGVDTKELNQRTMESKNCPGLYFIGEVVDVTGWLGGYNFQWAWASGYVCGRTV